MINTLAKFYLQKIKGLALPKDIIKYSVKMHHDKIAVVDNGRQATYGELYKRSMKLANALTGLGLGKGDKLGTLLYNCRECFELKIAAYFTGIVLVPIVWDTASDDIIFILNNCGVKYLIYHPEILKDGPGPLKQKTAVEHFIPVTEEAAAGSYEEILGRGARKPEPAVKIAPEDTASINFSSGTTGRPKGVSLPHSSWIGSFYNTVVNANPLAMKGERVFLHILSFATAGSTSFLALFFIGARQAVLKKYGVEECVEAITKNGVNTIYASPCVISDIVEYIGEKKIKIGLSAIFAGTENFPPARFREAIEVFGPVIRRGYGMVECLPPVSMISPEEYVKDGRIIESRLQSCGRPAKGVTLEIVEDDLAKAKAGAVGRIILKSSAVSSGYWKDPGLTAKHYRDGWFYSNDYGYKDKDGYLYVLGRLDDRIGSGAAAFFIGEVEDALNAHPAVKEACVINRENAPIAAVIALKKRYKDTKAADIALFCEERIGKDRVPQEIRVLEGIPKNASCKLNRQAVRRIFA